MPHHHALFTAPSLLSLLNPWQLNTKHYLLGYVAMRLGLLLGLDAALLKFAQAANTQKMPSRTHPTKKPYQHPIDNRDRAYLALNSIIEYLFALNLTHLVVHSSLVATSIADLNALNSVGALWLLLVFDDMLYAPAHRIMHVPALYKYVHKHHHRNTFPTRGYVDGANEHPVEQLVALSLHWCAILLTAHTSGVHAAAIGAHLVLKAAGACFNHTGYDVRLRLLGIDYSVRAHEMHHRKPQSNYAQYVMFWDRLMGTYVEYQSPFEPVKVA